MNTRAPDTLTPADTWRTHAACRGEFPDLFFPDGDSDRYHLQTEQAKAVCRRCPVMQHCLTFALQNGEDKGVWGGLDTDERRRLRRRYTWRLSNPTLLTEVVQAATDQAIEAAGTLPQPKSLREIYLRYAQPSPDGHTTWRSAKTSIRYKGRPYTPGKIAFIVGNGRSPQGKVVAACKVTGCVTPKHLTDERMRSGDAPDKARQSTRARRTPAEAHAKYTVPTVDGHTRWVGPHNPKLEGRSRTPKYIAFHTAHGRFPTGIVSSSCGLKYCVKPEHMEDGDMRAARQAADCEQLAAVS